MARHDNGHGVHCAGASHGANRGGAPDGTRDLAISARNPVRDAPQLFPDAPLKRCGLHVGRQIEVGFAPAQVSENFANASFEAVAVTANSGAWIFLCEGGFEAREIGGRAARGTGDQNQRDGEQAGDEPRDP